MTITTNPVKNPKGIVLRSPPFASLATPYFSLAVLSVSPIQHYSDIL